ncbi:hypothetical protein GCM10025857_31960 [Alicyclobacillus contaminans]|nr:hypothetical protein GCM10025857_31960 [Alicyclobacillus contaminans]
MPYSSTTARCDGRMLFAYFRVWFTKFRLSIDLKIFQRVDRIDAIISFVVDLPALPVMAITGRCSRSVLSTLTRPRYENE